MRKTKDKYKAGDLVWFNENGCWLTTKDTYPATVIRRHPDGYYECSISKKSDPNCVLINYLGLPEIQNGLAYRLDVDESYLTPKIEFNLDVSDLL